jgi:hypothetical protein
MSASDHEHEWVQVGGSASAVIRCACGANLGAVQGVLDGAAEDVRSAAGVSYYTGCRIRSESEAVELWLFEAPAQLLGQLKALHPGTYVIHNDAPRPETAVFELMDALRAERLTLKAEGIHVVGFGPTHDGYVHVRVMGDVPTAQARLDAMFGSNVARVEYGEPAHAC